MKRNRNDTKPKENFTKEEDQEKGKRGNDLKKKEKMNLR
jgi:hypothetical protein